MRIVERRLKPVIARVVIPALVLVISTGKAPETSSEGVAAKLKDIQVRWPNGESELFEAPAVDRILELTEGHGHLIGANSAKSSGNTTTQH